MRVFPKVEYTCFSDVEQEYVIDSADVKCEIRIPIGIAGQYNRETRTIEINPRRTLIKRIVTQLHEHGHYLDDYLRFPKPIFEIIMHKIDDVLLVNPYVMRCIERAKRRKP